MANLSTLRYPGEYTYFRWGACGAFGLHVLVAAVILIVAYETGVKSIEQLMKESGALELAPPPPDQPIEIDLKDVLPPPPPVENPEFVRQVVKLVPPPPLPVPVIPKPVVKNESRPVSHAHATVSKLIVGSGSFPQPGYPYEALINQETGTVTLAIRFDGNGKPSNVEIVKSSGHTDLDSGAREFVLEHWHDGEFANRSATVPIQFVL
jgi:protein TonB